MPEEQSHRFLQSEHQHTVIDNEVGIQAKNLCQVLEVIFGDSLNLEKTYFGR